MAKEKNKTELPQVVEGELQARLVKLREDAGFDVSQMADALCLSEEVITNLENEAFDLLPEPPYVRGYLRNYAKLSNEDDASELISRYEALRGADASELDFQIKSSHTINNTPVKRMSPIWGQVILLGIFIGALSLIASIPAVNTWISNTWQSFSTQMEPTDPSNNPILTGSLPVPAPLEDELPISSPNEASIDSPNTAAPANENSETATDTPATAEGTATNAETTSESTDTENTETSTETSATEISTDANTDNGTQEIAAASADGTINIKLVFNKEVWLRIKDKDNKTVFEGLNKAETEKTIDLKKPLTFRVGNAQGLSLFIDNKAVDISSYINGSIANFTLE